MNRLNKHTAGDLEDRHLILVLLILATLPHVFWLPVWISTSCGLFWLAAFVMFKKSARNPGRLVRLCLLGAILAVVLLSFGRTIGREAGTALLALLLSLKLFEMASLRDKVVILLLGLFLLFAAVLFSQSLLVGLYMFLVFWVYVAALCTVCHPGLRLTVTFRTSGAMILQALPFAIILFLLFPRLNSGVFGLSPDRGAARSGLSRTMAPGSVSSLARSQKVAFRAEFKGSPPPRSELYWRAVVLRHYDGTRWREGSPCSPIAPVLKDWSREQEYTILLEPTQSKLMVALDMPLISPVPEAGQLLPGFVLRASEAMTSTRQYTLRSALVYQTPRLNRRELSTCLDINEQTNPRTRELLADLVKQASSPRGMVTEILGYFRERDFSYTLTPSKLKPRHPIDDFLFRTREGYCEHYAQAFAWMLRAAGIPARIVAGYQGGELNPVGDYFIVRQAQAHAWVEAYFSGRGWKRIDPTRSIDPDRIDPALSESLSGLSDGAKPEAGLFARLEHIWHQTALTWDGLNHLWNTWILGYTQSRQNAFLQRTGLGTDVLRDLDRVILAGLAALLACLGLLLLVLLWPRPQHLEPGQASYRSFLKKLERAGLTRWKAEGPQDFADRAARLRPDLSEDIRAITRLYVRIRYREEAGREILAELRARVKGLAPGGKRPVSG